MTLSYEAILKRVKKISEGHTKVLDKWWLSEGAFVKFVGDNVDKQVSVRDIRSDHHGRLMHMFSIFAVKARVSPPFPLSLCTDTVDAQTQLSASYQSRNISLSSRETLRC